MLEENEVAKVSYTLVPKLYLIPKSLFKTDLFMASLEGVRGGAWHGVQGTKLAAVRELREYVGLIYY